MTIDEVRTLLHRIRVHYNRQEVSDAVVDEWYRLLGYLDYDEALAKLDAYLMLEDGNQHAPRIQWFKNARVERKDTYVPAHTFDRLDDKGRLVDEEGRMYAFTHAPDELYHYDSSGRIMDSKGRLVR